MSVYVDPLMRVARSDRWPFHLACHLIADTVDELHQFADKLGLKHKWFQDKGVPHYDLTKNKRYMAVRLGAKQLTREEFAEMYYRTRKVQKRRHETC